MPFDPRLINPDDAPEDALGEIDLPDDLLELAAQLRDDAVFLSERYPAKLNTGVEFERVAATTALPRSASAVRPLLILGGIAAAIALTIGLTYRPLSPSRELAQPTVVPAVDVAATEPALPHHEISVSVPTTSRSKPRIERLPWAPTPALGEVTGPELEGLLDLWQNDEHPAETRISI